MTRTPVWLRLFLSGLWLVLLPVHVWATVRELHGRGSSTAGILAPVALWRWPIVIVAVEARTLADVWRLDWSTEQGANSGGE